MSKPEYLYHYCSLKSFLNIIQNRTLWLCDIGKSNDFQELVWLKTQCAYRIESIRNIYLNQNLNINNDILKKLDEAKEIANYAQRADVCKSWAFCLSEERDLLSQWRGYANDGAGVAIGFKRAYLEEINEPFKDMQTRFQYALRKVNYSYEGIEAFFKTTAIHNISLSEDHDIIDIMLSAIADSAKNAAYYKNPCFAEEKEWRLAYTDTLINFSGYDFEKMEPVQSGVFSRLPFHKMGSFATSNDIISYIEIGLPHMEEAIHEIIIGPKAKLNIDDMKLAMVINGLLKNIEDKTISVTVSTSSYR